MAIDNDWATDEEDDDGDDLEYKLANCTFGYLGITMSFFCCELFAMNFWLNVFSVNYIALC